MVVQTLFVNIIPEGKVTTIEISPVNHSQGQVLLAELESLDISFGSTLVLCDLSRPHHLPEGVIEALLLIDKNLKKINQRLRIHGAHGAVLESMKTKCLDRVLLLFETREEAILGQS